MQARRLTIALPLLILGGALIVLAGAQLVVMLNGIERWGWQNVAIARMTERALLYAVPAMVAVVVAVVVLRRR